MKLLYIANARIPTEKAHGINIVQMCHALGIHGVDVTLVLPHRNNTISRDLFVFYGISENFVVEELNTPDLVSWGSLGYWISQLLFSVAVWFRCRREKKTTILTRDEWSGWLLAISGYSVYYDMHGFPVKWMVLWKMAMKKMSGIICTNEWKISQLQKTFKIPKQRLVLARNGFDQQKFSLDISKADARHELGLPTDKKIVMYVGHLYDWKGARVLADAGKYIDQTLMVFVGGTTGAVKEFKNLYANESNILVLGQKSHQEVPKYMKAADILVLPNSKKSKNLRAIPYSIYDTSPIKMFEYMASGRPIIASSLPSITEVLNEKTATFFEPDNPIDLADKIKYVFDHYSESERKAYLACELVQKYSWEERAVTVISFIKRPFSNKV